MSTEPTAAAHAPPSTGLAAGITLAAIILIAGFIALGTALHLQPLYAGFTLLWFWTTVDMSDLKKLPAAVIGALAGTATSYMVQIGASTGNTALVIAALAIIIIALFMVIAQRMALVFNASYMLFVTVMNAPLIQQGENFQNVFASIALATLYFGGIFYIGSRIMAGRAAQAASA
ncbi:hypothetical protein OLX02_09865 [Novosphingobium sp. KCTC 2891]|uniref:hypothetical protein n=1 Tax=Novosphingobium sp. KCTC 2891 TaxID=2989730 RepID=UPI0022213D3B|nr:hypothetical protein [Novosphingobium sp. KCTC 2891]MCW1383129.1 hypothetical protein [Novosphingobium sp. KCTC 2891]